MLIGDTVNVAARLQVSTRTLGVSLVIGDPPVKALREGSSVAASKLPVGFEDLGEHAAAGAVRIWTRKRAPGR